ncbi:DUF6146 family protein [uncultured Nonlabens sp.]|uniref:DUF6146 family protein n=1 Tax=uncultured Nonlabens sp. TaxID=859306 RepID=UPI002614710D|nr:DUF6146 family protein [uncultured Nonlabens sp.]
MKTFIYSIFVMVAIVGCSTMNTGPDKKLTSINSIKNDTIRIVNDSLEYEIIIFEPGFNSWLVTQPPRGYYSQSAMEISNTFKVTTYNIRSRNPLKYGNDLYPFAIDYNRRTDYGYEVNYLLYNYFLFFEQKYNQRLK